MERIDNNERENRVDIDRILQHIGLERNTNPNMMVEYTPGSEARITTVMDDTLNRYNTLSNVSKIVVNEKLKFAIADFLSATTERAMNAKFHNSLSYMEQCGILSPEKYNMHIQKVNAVKGMVNIGTSIVCDVAPLIFDYLNTRIQHNKLKDFIIGSVAYINRETNPLINKHIWETFMQAGIVKPNMNMDISYIHTEFDRYANPDGLYTVPMLDNKIKTNLQQEDAMAKKIISICDLSNIDVQERALEFLESFLRINYQEAKLLLEDAKYSQESLSEIILYSSINYETFFSDFISNISHAQRFARYDLSNDVQKKIRDERKDTMEQIIQDTINKKGLFFTAEKRADLIEANARIMSASLNNGFKMGTEAELIERNYEVGEYLGLL